MNTPAPIIHLEEFFKAEVRKVEGFHPINRLVEFFKNWKSRHEQAPEEHPIEQTEETWQAHLASVPSVEVAAVVTPTVEEPSAVEVQPEGLDTVVPEVVEPVAETEVHVVEVAPVAEVAAAPEVEPTAGTTTAVEAAPVTEPTVADTAPVVEEPVVVAPVSEPGTAPLA